jgi:short-subunit dehydrogenase
MSAEQMRAIFATNVFGTTDCIRAAVPAMSNQPPRDGWRGQIMIVTSAAARRGLPYNGAYSATKAAQLSIAEALRVELRPQQIAVTSVHPIGTATEFFDMAEQVSGRKLYPPGKAPKRHSVERVVDGMIRGIRRPCGEVWSSRPTRWGLVFNAAFPTLGDGVVHKGMEKFQKLNRLSEA